MNTYYRLQVVITNLGEYTQAGTIVPKYLFNAYYLLDTVPVMLGIQKPAKQTKGLYS